MQNQMMAIPERQDKFRKSNFWNKPKEELAERIQVLGADSNTKFKSGRNSISQTNHMLRQFNSNDRMNIGPALQSKHGEKSLIEDFSLIGGNSIIENSIKDGEDPNQAKQRQNVGKFNKFSQRQNLQRLNIQKNNENRQSLRKIEKEVKQDDYNFPSPSEFSNLNQKPQNIKKSYENRSFSQRNSVFNNTLAIDSTRRINNNNNCDLTPAVRSRTTSFYNQRSIKKNNHDYSNFNRNKSNNAPYNNQKNDFQVSQYFMDDLNEAKLKQKSPLQPRLSRHISKPREILDSSKNIILHPLNFNGKHMISSGSITETVSSVSSSSYITPPGSNYTRIVPSKYHSPSKMSRNSKNSNFMDSNKKNLNPAIRRLQTKQNLMNSTQSQCLIRSIFVPRGQEVETINDIQVEGYKVLNKIGCGSFATVYKGRHEGKNKIVVRSTKLGNLLTNFRPSR